MLQNVLMFLAPANTSQATPSSPPAVASPARPLVRDRSKLRFGAAVLGNTVGCGAIFAACWFSLQLMQLLLQQA
jgi:hypothetical protein